MRGARPVEWPTLILLAVCYGVWALGTTWIAAWSQPAGIAVTAMAIAQFSSLQHEALHGHPFRSRRANAALVFPALALMIPYLRFRDTHLDHHRDETLTDPYDDPESNYFDPAVWHRLPRAVQLVLRINNTLLGRILLGTAISQISFMISDVRAIKAGDARVIRGWLWQIPALVPVVAWLAVVAQMPVWAYLVAVYAGLSLIKIRTFLEHCAHALSCGRTVIIEDRGPLAFLFLNNNLHAVHHAMPGVPWYHLPGVYGAAQAAFRQANLGYVYRSYGQIFRRYLFSAKDPVVHPLWPQGEPAQDTVTPAEPVLAVALDAVAPPIR